MQALVGVFRPRQLDSRLFTDNIYKASSMYAAYHPSAHRLGDYGFIDKKTGEFVKEGNLVDDFPEELGRYFDEGNVTECAETARVFKRSKALNNQAELDFGADMPNLADCQVKAGWSHHKDRFAVLILVDPILVSLKYEGGLRDSLMALLTPRSRTSSFVSQSQSQSQSPSPSPPPASALAPLTGTKMNPHKYVNKAVVTQMYKSTSYALIMTNGHKGRSYAGLRLKPNVNTNDPSTLSIKSSPASGSVDVEYEWDLSTESGSWSTGLYEKENHKYTQLFSLRTIEGPKLGRKHRGMFGDVEVEIEPEPEPEVEAESEVDHTDNLDGDGDEKVDGDSDGDKDGGDENVTKKPKDKKLPDYPRPWAELNEEGEEVIDSDDSEWDYEDSDSDGYMDADEYHDHDMDVDED